MAGVQNSWSKGLYKVGTIGIEKLILHLRYEAGPIGNDAVHKLGASVALVELWYGEHCFSQYAEISFENLFWYHSLWCFAPIMVFNMGDKASSAFVEPKRQNAVGILR